MTKQQQQQQHFENHSMYIITSVSCWFGIDSVVTAAAPSKFVLHCVENYIIEIRLFGSSYYFDMLNENLTWSEQKIFVS